MATAPSAVEEGPSVPKPGPRLARGCLKVLYYLALWVSQALARQPPEKELS